MVLYTLVHLDYVRRDSIEELSQKLWCARNPDQCDGGKVEVLRNNGPPVQYRDTRPGTFKARNNRIY